MPDIKVNFQPIVTISWPGQKITVDWSDSENNAWTDEPEYAEVEIPKNEKGYSVVAEFLDSFGLTTEVSEAQFLRNLADHMEPRTPSYEQLLAFAQDVASWRKDGEPIDPATNDGDDTYILENDTAVDLHDGVVTTARHLLGLTLWEVKYSVITGIDNSVVSSGLHTPLAVDADTAGRAAVTWAHENDPHTDPRIDPRVVIDSVKEAEGFG